MNNNLFFFLYGCIIGTLLTYLIINIKQQKKYISQKIENKNFEQELKFMHQEINNHQHIQQKYEQQINNDKIEIRELYNKLATTESELSSMIHFRKECDRLTHELQIQQKNNNNQEVKLREISVRLEETQSAAEEKQRLLTNNEQRLLLQFENLANRIFEHNGHKVGEQNRQSLDQLLIPLREQLEGFRRHVQDSFSKEERERHTLTHEIHNLQQLNEQMAKEAINLTQALKGNNKIHGNWGELILSRVLEASGLREGHEFDTQISIQQNDGRRLQPDVIVHLPQGKNVIIDAKMSLIAYERYFNSDDILEREEALSEHINSLRNHIKSLGNKDYQKSFGLRSLDYVLMFIPIEPAFLVAISHQPNLISEALTHNVMLVSPTTLLVALRTINNLWHYEHQNHNAERIAEKASCLYDKLRLFIEHMNAIGQGLDKAQNSYQLAKNKLSSGRGNILAHADEFRVLGVVIKRPINTTSNTNTNFFDESNKENNTSKVIS